MARKPGKHTDAIAARRALLARIENGFEVIVEPLRFGEIVFDFTRVANPDTLLERMDRSVIDDPDDEPACQPYWAAAWESGWVIAEELAAAPLASRSGAERVLDLGCGLGLAGCVAAARGARVVFADAVPNALLFARLNSWPWRSRVDIRRVDWRNDLLPWKFERILGADILYDERDWPYLDRFWQTHLAVGGHLLLAEPGRETGQRFPAWLLARGWRMFDDRLRAAPGGKLIRLLRFETVNDGDPSRRT
jgi:predicted nicotinamide N-methyase